MSGFDSFAPTFRVDARSTNTPSNVQPTASDAATATAATTRTSTSPPPFSQHIAATHSTDASSTGADHDRPVLSMGVGLDPLDLDEVEYIAPSNAYWAHYCRWTRGPRMKQFCSVKFMALVATLTLTAIFLAFSAALLAVNFTT